MKTGRPISRVLCLSNRNLRAAAIHLRLGLAHELKRPTRRSSEAGNLISPAWPFLRVGLAVPPVSPPERWSLTPPFHHCRLIKVIGCIFSVALSVLLRAPRVTRHPALVSSDFPPAPTAAGGRPACLVNFGRCCRIGLLVLLWPPPAPRNILVPGN